VLKQNGNLLMLDEPTNDADVDLLRALENAIMQWPGTVLCISHDRYFLDRSVLPCALTIDAQSFCGHHVVSRSPDAVLGMRHGACRWWLFPLPAGFAATSSHSRATHRWLCRQHRLAAPAAVCTHVMLAGCHPEAAWYPAAIAMCTHRSCSTRAATANMQQTCGDAMAAKTQHGSSTGADAESHLPCKGFELGPGPLLHASCRLKLHCTGTNTI
jgi:hypothetical protein